MNSQTDILIISCVFNNFVISFFQNYVETKFNEKLTQSSSYRAAEAAW